MFGELNPPTCVQWSAGEEWEELRFPPHRGLCLFSLQMGLACFIYGMSQRWKLMFVDVCFCSVINWIWLEKVSNVSYSHTLIIFVNLV